MPSSLSDGKGKRLLIETEKMFLPILSADLILKRKNEVLLIIRVVLSTI